MLLLILLVSLSRLTANLRDKEENTGNLAPNCCVMSILFYFSAVKLNEMNSFLHSNLNSLFRSFWDGVSYFLTSVDYSIGSKSLDPWKKAGVQFSDIFLYTE